MRRNRFADLQRRFATLPPRFLSDAKQRFGRMEGILRVLGPDATLRRGYSITTDKNGKVVRSIVRVKRGIRLHTRVTDGDIESEVLAAHAQDRRVSR